MERAEVQAPNYFGPDSNGIAAQKGFRQDYARIKRVDYTHDAMIDLIIANPTATNKELATNFGFTEQWISRVINSDAFQARLEERKRELTDPFLRATIDEKLKGLADQALDVIADKLAATQNPDLALKALDLTTKALGFGARVAPSAPAGNTYIVNMPVKAPSSAEWAAGYKGSSIEAKSLSTTVTRDPRVPLTPTQVIEE